ncbi:MAG: hypothetical protein M1834_007322 [Cirrosporium novae-zelandiae]|nr:MAG: hypothetical protein M1834_007322 [Cirrosporium novae-zelandiae]
MNYLDNQLCADLSALSARFENKYSSKARRELLQILFHSLVGNRESYLHLLFPNRVSANVIDDNELENWDLRAAQGAVEGAEYTEAARGKACGHILKNGESTYRCKTCTTDDTCVLCSRCFEASDHTGHVVYVSPGSGNSGCCDCGDPEAWKIPVKCAIHTADASDSTHTTGSSLPDGVPESIKTTIGRTFDFLCDVISCCPEQLRLPKTVESVKEDEANSFFTDGIYKQKEPVKSSESEYSLVIWNDEKHTIRDVEHQVSRACKNTRAWGREKATETNDIGRSILLHSIDLPRLVDMARIIEQIKLTVSVRSSRDTFREEMCGTMIEWLLNISGCSVGDDPYILRQTICEQMLEEWRVGSCASNAQIGKDGIYDHETEENHWYNQSFSYRRIIRARITIDNLEVNIESDDDDDDDDDDENDDDNDDEDDEEDDEDDGGDEDEDTDDDYNMVEIEMLQDEEDGDGDTAMGGVHDGEEQATLSRQDQDMADGQASEDPLTANIVIPKTPNKNKKGGTLPRHWLERNQVNKDNLPLHDDLRKRLRLDWLLLFDLRLWKKARIDLRDLYIGTVVSIPEFKRIIGLRFAGLYTPLAQLYLIGDREPDQSIIKLSLQMLTTPSIIQEVIERGNFLTKLLAVIYTFLTTRQVGYPHQVTPKAALDFDEASLHNRRLWHFFMDLSHLLEADYTKSVVRKEERYLLQFLDLFKLPQGICAYKRAVGEHVEYEADSWVSASLLTRQINQLCRQFSACFKRKTGEDNFYIRKAIRRTAKVVMNISMGIERKQSEQSEIKDVIKFHELQPFDFECNRGHRVVAFEVHKGYISFHHPLHYTLSWLVECARSMSKEELREALHFKKRPVVKDPEKVEEILKLTPEDYVLSIFDYPLRVCVWLSQMKTGMWVRNGLSLRHQMTTYRGPSQRDITHHRDIVLLQTAMVICDPSRFLANMIDRYDVTNWIRGDFTTRSVYDDTQLVDLTEDFLHLLIVLLSDRISLLPMEQEPNPQLRTFRRDVVHILCFKPLSFSTLTDRLADKFADLDDFQEILDEMTIYRPPEGLSDAGTFELKPQYLEEVDPYMSHYNKNQRDEAENAYRNWVAKKTGKNPSEVVYEPRLLSIQSGAFSDLAAFTRTALFLQVIYSLLAYAVNAKTKTPKVASSRIESFLQVLLHLILVAIHEDKTEETDNFDGSAPSFVNNALCVPANEVFAKIYGGPDMSTIVGILAKLSKTDEYSNCNAKVRLVLRRFWQKRPRMYDVASSHISLLGEIDRTDSPASISSEQLDLQKKKKKQAAERQAKVLAQFQQQQKNFLANQGDIDWGEEDLSDLDSPSTLPDENKKTWKFPTGTCVLCREETNDSRLYGTFALLSDSNILRQTEVTDPDWVKEAASIPPSLDRNADNIRPFGVAGLNTQTVRKLTSDGREIVSKREELSKGFPSQCHRRGPVSVGCGHIMHYSCFETYCTAIERRHAQQVARNQPDRLPAKEFVCPLCKALGNVFYPIIWQGKEEKMAPLFFRSQTLFNDWLRYEVYLNIFRRPQPKEQFSKYSTEAIMPSLASQVSHAISRQPRTSPFHFVPGAYPAEGISLVPGDSNPRSEMMSVYMRLRDSMSLNVTSSRRPYQEFLQGQAEDLKGREVLASALGFTISAAEMAQRGVESEVGSTLLDKVPQSTITHLKILAETAYSYAVIGGLQDLNKNLAPREFQECFARQVSQLFVGQPEIAEESNKLPVSQKARPLFAEDIFIFLAECSVCLIPVAQLTVHHVLRLCYLAEVVKVVITFIANHDALPLLIRAEDMAIDYSQLLGFRMLVLLLTDQPQHPLCNGPSFSALYRLVRNYALTFLRKTVILLHVRYSVEFPSTGFADVDEPELERLTRILQLPTLNELGFSLQDPIIQPIIKGWLHHAKDLPPRNTYSPRDSTTMLSLSHPSIPELVGLPKRYYVLLDEALRRRCPTTGKDLSDPAICLFCGEIFCSQAYCCTQEKSVGGCNDHMTKCGGNVGLFINIRKCEILYLHNRHGSWTHAPYLDKHGEVDPSLRRGRELFLNQKRYDALLRNVWLQHQIPSTISRRLEAEINTGGWETL